MRVWMIRDPLSGRIGTQLVEPGDDSFPVGERLRRAVWPMCQGVIPDAQWEDLLAGRLTPDEQDALHVEAWEAAGGAPWPE